MSLASVTAAGRRAAEARMTSRATVRRKATATTTLPNGRKVPLWDTIHVDLPFRSSGQGSRTVEVGGVVWEDATGIGHFPADTTDLQDSDLVLVTAGEWTGDVFRIVAAVRYDQKTARRVPIVEAQAPSEWSA